MCLKNLFAPDIPEVEPVAPPPIPKQPPRRPEEVEDAKPLQTEDEKARVTYGEQRSKLTTEGAKAATKKSVVPLNRSTLASTGASQQGLGGTTG